MADKKISELTAITGANTAADDYFVVVDTSGTATKKISRAELNNAIEADVLSTVNIDGGTIDGTVIGGATPAAGTFTDVIATGTGNRSVTITSSDALATMEIGGTTGAFIDIKTPSSDDYDLRLSGGSTGGGITIGGGTFTISGSAETLATFTDDGAVTLLFDNSAKLATASGGVNVTGDVNATTFVGNLTGNASGTAATVTTAAQPAITSVGTLTGLGIGAAASAGKLHVTNSTGTIGYFESTQASANVSNLVGNATQTNSSANLVLQINGGTTAQALVRCNGDNSMAFFNGASPTEKMRLLSGGELSVGTTSNTGMINATASSWSKNCLYLNSATTGGGQADFCGIGMTTAGTASANIYTDESHNFSITRATGGNFYLKSGSAGISGGTTQLTLTDDGKVGIGGAPGSNLHVFGGSFTLEHAGNTTLYTKNTTTADVIGGIQSLSNQSVRVGSVTAHPTEIVYQNSVKATANATGFGINCATANAQMTIKASADNVQQLKLEQSNGGDGYGLICDMTDGALAFSRYTSAGGFSEKMRIDLNGAVGIGRSDPQNLIGSTAGGLVLQDGGRAATTTQFGIYNSSGTASMTVLQNATTYFKGRVGIANTGPNSASLHVNNTASNEQVIYNAATHASYGNINTLITVTRAANSAYSFLQTKSGVGDVEHNLRGDGEAYADGSWNAGGADYSEYFEFQDGNPDNEDRRGLSVVLDDEKIRAATANDDPSEIIGVISGNPCVVGDSGWNRWKSKYLRDDFGAYDLDENGDRQTNPDYDPDQEYIPRSDRKEWSTVGLMGKLRVKKGQQVGDRWIKMRDINSDIEEYLVR